MPRDRDQEPDYEVGYSKPPRHTRFKPGVSGNPRGRPKDAKNLSTLVHEALNEPVVVAENGRRRKVSKRQAIITQLVNRSAQADLKASCSASCKTSSGAAKPIRLRLPSTAPTRRSSNS